jgi:hypothetical protein
VEAQRQRVQVAEHAQGDGAHGALGHAREQEFAQLGEDGGGQAQHAVGDQRAERQHQQRLRVRRIDGQLVDQPFHHQRHADVGQLGGDQAAQGRHHAPFVYPQVGNQGL